MAPSHFISPILESIQLGTPTSYGFESSTDAHDNPWTTGFFKTPVQGPVFATTTNLAGDGHADLINHGGVDKAVLAYSADHYPNWLEELGLADMPFGAFGENLTISGLGEESVCIGDVFRVGTVTFEVSPPRQPCWKLARRWRMHELVRLVVQSGRSGWYFRVLEEGWIEARSPVALLERPNPEWSIARANKILHHRSTDLGLTIELASVPKLAVSWVGELQERAEQLRASSTAK